MIFGASRFPKSKGVSVSIPKAALEAVFDECDRYDADETGGRILGTYQESGGRLHISVTGIIEPGPAAQRTATYFKQDGEHQEKVFRSVEAENPSIEHLGNWHTHHVNGLRHLSGGDLDTYHKTVNHQNHNTDFFYALLVIEKRGEKTGLNRYVVKHYLIRRSDSKSYEIPSTAIAITDDALVWPIKAKTPAIQQSDATVKVDALNRVYDRDTVASFFPFMKVFMSEELGVFWRGPIQLVDGSEVEVLVVEQAAENSQAFVATVRKPSPMLEPVKQALADSVFGSCREALISTERMCNSALYQGSRQR